MMQNRYADSLTLLLPFAAPPSGLLGDVLRQLELSALQKLLARASAPALESAPASDGEAPSLPHERWLAAHAGLSISPEGAVATAPFTLAADGGTPGDTLWYCAQPVHLHAARDHLVLTDPAALDLQADEALALLDAARPVLDDMAAQCHTASLTRWYVSAEKLGVLRTVSPLRACGRNIDIWMPRDAGAVGLARQWRKWQNEIQMIWYDQPVNQRREAHGQLTVNSLWLHGLGQATTPTLPFKRVLTNDGYARGLALLSGTRTDALPDHANAVEPGTLALLDSLIPAALNDDWGSWINAMQTLEQAWFAPALAGLETGRFAALHLVFCSEFRWSEVTVRSSDRWKFWRRHDLGSLLRPLQHDERSGHA